METGAIGHKLWAFAASKLVILAHKVPTLAEVGTFQKTNSKSELHARERELNQLLVLLLWLGEGCH